LTAVLFIVACALAGAPDLAFKEAVKLEHCDKEGHDFEFTTSNYKIKTTSKKEYNIVVNNEPVDPADMMHSRRIPNLKDLKELEMSKTADLRMIEIIMLVLYTGPMVSSSRLCMMMSTVFPLVFFSFVTSLLSIFRLLNVAIMLATPFLS
jgi:hypothetical protein